MPSQARFVFQRAAWMSAMAFVAFQFGGLCPLRAADITRFPPSPVCDRGTDETGRMPGWDARPYTIHLPPSYDGVRPHPVLIVLHGGAGNRTTARLETCPNQNPNNPACLDRVADCEGFIVVYPDGTYASTLFRSVRTFNAGGGTHGYVCMSGYACDQNIDDVGYVSDLLDTLERDYRIDPARVFVTGLSNGAALTHRLACALSDRIAAIAPISGVNQYSTGAACVPARSVPVLEIHGTADHCVPYDGGYDRCTKLQPYGLHLSVPDTVAGWVSRNGCGAIPAVGEWPDVDPSDGTTVTQMTYPDCPNGGDVVLLRINGGGHTWPGGSDTLPYSMTGKVSREFNASEVILQFFEAHPMN